MFKNPFSFEGRIGRTEYGLSVFMYAFAIAIIFELFTWLELRVGTMSLLLFLLLLLVPIWFMFAQNAKRCHDMGNSGWYQIIPFYIILMLLVDSDNGINEYGPNPKGIDNSEQNEKSKSEDEFTDEEIAKIRALKMEKGVDLNNDFEP